MGKQQDLARTGSNQSERVAVIVAPGLTVAHFTDRELLEIRKLCRDAKNSGEGSELAWKFLEAGIARASGERK